MEMRTRSGLTLMEVLVAIFVTSLGLLGLLALFPVGALSMSKAIQSERATECALNADAAANMLIYRDMQYTTPSPPPVGSSPVDLRRDYNITQNYTNPGGVAPGGPLPTLTAPYADVSYAVYIDPLGV